MLEFFNINTILTFFVFLMISYILWDSLTQKNMNIPGPIPWPVIGNLPVVFGSKNVGETYLQLQRKFGNLVRLKLGRRNLVVVFGYKNAREVLVDNSDKTKFRPPARKIFPKGGGLAISNGQLWQDLRKFTIVALKDFGVGKKSIEQRIQEETEFLISHIEGAKKSPLDVSEIFSKVTSNIISNIIFGARFDYEDKEFTRLTDRISQLFKLQAGFSITTILPFLYYFLPSNQVSKLTKCRNDIQDYIRTRIGQQRESFDPKNIRSFLDLYIEQEGKPDSKITEDSLLCTIADLYFAGTDTTSMSLHWCMLYMLKYPEIQKKCRKEILEVIGDGRLPVAKDRHELPFIMATLHEVQRIATIAPNAVPHKAIDDITVEGMTIPKGSTIIISLLSVHRDPSIWNDPDIFRPERFLDDNGKFVKVDGFTPFSLGPRICPGRQLAETELFMFFVSIMQRFNLMPENDTAILDTTKIQTGTTTQPKPFKMIFAQR